MIPSSNNFINENLYNQKIKIQLTNDNRCIIQSTLETPNKSQQNTINKSEKSININYTDNDNTKINFNDNNKSNKKISNNENNIDYDGNSNLLISFSNISELTKLNNDNSIFGRMEDSNKKIPPSKQNESDTSSILNHPMSNIFDNSKIYDNNKEKIDINTKNKSINMGLFNKSEYSNDKFNLVSSSKKSNNANSNILKRENSNLTRQLLDSSNINNMSDISDIVNWNINNKSIISNKDKDKKQNKNNDNLDKINIIEHKDNNEKKENNANENKKLINKKVFKYIKTENTNNIQINNINDIIKEKEKNENNLNKEKIIPNHCTNFSFGGNIINNNINHFLINNINNINIENVSNKVNLGNNPNNNYNEAIKNDDYISPTFNINLDFNALDNNNNINNNMKKENYNNVIDLKNKKIKNIEEKKIINVKINSGKENEIKNILNNKSGKLSQINNRIKIDNTEELKNIKNLSKYKKRDTYLIKNNDNNIIAQHLIYKEKKNKSFNNLNSNSNSNSNISESLHFNLNNDFNNISKISKISKRKHSYIDSNKNFNNNILSRLYRTNPNTKQSSSPNQNIIHTYNHYNTNENKKRKKSISHNKSKSNSGNISKMNSKLQNNLINVGKILVKTKSPNHMQSISKEKQNKSTNIIHSKNNSMNNNNFGKLNKNKISILNKEQLNILEIRKKIRKSPVPKTNKLSPPSKTKMYTNSNSNGHNNAKYTIYNNKKFEEKSYNIFMNHIHDLNIESNKKKINLAIKKTSPGSLKNIHSNNNSNLVNRNYINKNIGNLLFENNNIKLKISKKAINNCLNEFKPHINDYSEISFNTNKSNNTNNKHKLFIKNRKRNCSFGYSSICNSSNNQSKDSNKNYRIKTIQNSQSGERNKISNNQNNSKISPFNCSNLNKNNITKQSNNKNNNLILSKFKVNKKNEINKQSKKLTIIQNFSRYKKKSTLLNKNNSEINDYLINDENNNRENIIKAGNI